MSTVHLLNFDNDGALASGKPYYTPSKQAKIIEEELAFLPAIWADEGDAIVAVGDAAPSGLVKEIFQEKKLTIYHPGIQIDKALPWGWSEDASRRFTEAGVDSSILPGHQKLERLRQLSHRRTAMHVSRYLRDKGIECLNNPVELFEAAELGNLLEENQQLLLKRPWSCSGRGVFPINTVTPEKSLELAQGIIRRQGSVMVETLLNRVFDFSALFYSDGQAVKFKGWSAFKTSPEGKFLGSLVADQSYLTDVLSTFDKEIYSVPAILETELTKMLCPDYTGWLSVDMMFVKEHDRIITVPCVEINMRMTMGCVAFILAESPYISATETPLLLSMTFNDGLIDNDDIILNAGNRIIMSLKRV